MPTTSNKISYEIHGDGPITLVMLPGLGCSTHAWDAVRPLLEDYRLVLLDLPGHAGSIDAPADGSSLTSISRPVIEALDELHLGPIVLVGLSFGSAISVRVALERPDDVQAVVAFMPWNAGGTDLSDAFMPQVLAAYGVPEATRQMVEVISLDTSKTHDVLDTMSTATTEEFWRSWYGRGVYTSISDELPSMRVPVTYVLGGRDAVAPRDKLIDDVQAMPGGRLVYLAEAGHLAPYEHPELVAPEIRDVVARVQGGAVVRA